MRRVTFGFAAVLTVLAGFASDLSSFANSRIGIQQTSAQQTPAPARFAFGGNADEIPAEFLENLILVPADVNKSQPLLFVLGSTAASSSISPARVADPGLSDLEDAILNFSGVDMPIVDLAKIDKPDFSQEVGRPYQGTLGADFFSRVVVEIDYGRQTLRFYDPAAYKYTGRGAVIPLRFNGAAPLIKASLKLAGLKTREDDFVVNTALDASVMISDRFSEVHRIFSSHVKTINASDPQIEGGATVALGRLTEFEIGRYEIRGPVAAFVHPGANSSLDNNRAGVVGGGLIRRFTVIFDYVPQQLILAPNPHFEDYEQEDKSGIAVVAKGTGLLTFE